MQSPCHERGTSFKSLSDSCFGISSVRLRPRFCFALGNSLFRIWDKSASAYGCVECNAAINIVARVGSLSTAIISDARRLRHEGAALLRLGYLRLRGKLLLSLRENFRGVTQIFTSDDVNASAVVKIRHDLQPDIALGIGNNPHDRAHAFLITKLHNVSDMRHTSYVHRF